MSRARAKGTEGENYFLEFFVQRLWPAADRAPLKGIHDAGDFLNVPFPIEAKNVEVPRFLEWVKVLRRKAPSHRWLLLWKGDMRKATHRPMAIMDPAFALELLDYWLTDGGPAEPYPGEVVDL